MNKQVFYHLRRILSKNPDITEGAWWLKHFFSKCVKKIERPRIYYVILFEVL